jgi:hypothetical protein
MTTQQDPPFTPFVADVITAMMSQTHATTNSLIDSLTAQLADARADLDAIRFQVEGLLGGPYMPTPDAILRALYPSAELRKHFRRDGES